MPHPTTPIFMVLPCQLPAPLRKAGACDRAASSLQEGRTWLQTRD
jgi:hypothetical protein